MRSYISHRRIIEETMQTIKMLYQLKDDILHYA